MSVSNASIPAGAWPFVDLGYSWLFVIAGAATATAASGLIVWVLFGNQLKQAGFRW